MMSCSTLEEFKFRRAIVNVPFMSVESRRAFEDLLAVGVLTGEGHEDKKDYKI